MNPALAKQDITLTGATVWPGWSWVLRSSATQRLKRFPKIAIVLAQSDVGRLWHRPGSVAESAGF